MALMISQLVKSIMVSITAAAAEPDLEQEAKPFARSIARHSGMLTVMHSSLQSAQQASSQRADAEASAAQQTANAATAAGILSPGGVLATPSAAPRPASLDSVTASAAQRATQAGVAAAKVEPPADAVPQPGPAATPQLPVATTQLPLGTNGFPVGTPGGRPRSASRPAAPHPSRLLEPLVYVEALMEVTILNPKPCVSLSSIDSSALLFPPGLTIPNLPLSRWVAHQCSSFNGLLCIYTSECSVHV